MKKRKQFFRSVFQFFEFFQIFLFVLAEVIAADPVFFGIDHADILTGAGNGPAGVVELDGNRLGQKIAVDDMAASFLAFTAVAAAGHGLFQFQITGVFVFKAAFQSAAHAGNSGRGEREVLLLGHFDVDGVKFGKEGTAAEAFHAGCYINIAVGKGMLGKNVFATTKAGGRCFGQGYGQN